MAEVSRLRRRWPALGLALWGVASVGLVAASRAGHWTPGVTVLAGSAWLLVLALASRDALRNLFGPVFAYEALRLGRRKLTFLLRFLYCLLLVALLAVLYASWMSQQWRYGADEKVSPSKLAGFANTFFETLAVVQFTVAALLTPAYVAGTIADEKERKTLEFLLATDLESREIVFGKLVARVTNLLMYILAWMPIIAFLQLFGGIDPEIALAVAAATALLVVGLSALSILFSVLARKPRDAIALTYAAFFLYLLTSGIVGLLASFGTVQSGTLFTLGGESFDWGDLTDWFVAGNPIYTVPVRTSGGTNLDADIVSELLRGFAIFWGIASALLIGWAVFRLRSVALEQGHGEPRAGASAKGPDRTEIGDDPILWREVFTGRSRAGCLGWFFRIVVILLLLAIPALIGYESFIFVGMWRAQMTFAERWADFREGMTIWVRTATGFLSLLIYFGAALRGAASVSGERDRDTWISLISAPLTPWEVLRGKFLGAVLGMRFFYTALVIVWGVGLTLGSIHILSLLPAVAHLIVYVSAFALLGMLCSLSARTTLVASLRGFAVAFFFMGGYWIALLLFCALPLNLMGGSSGGQSLDRAAELAAAFTPPFMSGYWPMPKFDRENAGFYHPNDYSIGPIAPVVAFGAWLGFTVFLASAVHGRMILAMNRGRKYRKAMRS